MATKIHEEIDRLRSLLTNLGVPWNAPAGASPESLARVEQKTGITFDEDLKSLWLFANGSNSESWFVDCGPDGGDTRGFYFLSIDEAEKHWARFLPYDEKIYRNWYYDGSWGETDRRIQPTFLKHRLWFPFAEWNGGSMAIQFDADPTREGKYGQIIKFVHDPDTMSFTADSFIELFHQSNDDLESWSNERPEELKIFLK